MFWIDLSFGVWCSNAENCIIALRKRQRRQKRLRNITSLRSTVEDYCITWLWLLHICLYFRSAYVCILIALFLLKKKEKKNTTENCHNKKPPKPTKQKPHQPSRCVQSAAIYQTIVVIIMEDKQCFVWPTINNTFVTRACWQSLTSMAAIYFFQSKFLFLLS